MLLRGADRPALGKVDPDLHHRAYPFCHNLYGGRARFGRTALSVCRRHLCRDHGRVRRRAFDLPRCTAAPQQKQAAGRAAIVLRRWTNMKKARKTLRFPCFLLRADCAGSRGDCAFMLPDAPPQRQPVRQTPPTVPRDLPLPRRNNRLARAAISPKHIRSPFTALSQRKDSMPRHRAPYPVAAKCALAFFGQNMVYCGRVVRRDFPHTAGRSRDHIRRK